MFRRQREVAAVGDAAECIVSAFLGQPSFLDRAGEQLLALGAGPLELCGDRVDERDFVAAGESRLECDLRAHGPRADDGDVLDLTHHLYVHVSMEQFEAAAQAAVDSIPDDFKPYLENTIFIIEESSPEGLMGLYEGATALGAGEGMPERLTLYHRSHY